MALPLRSPKDDKGILAKPSPPNSVCLVLVVPREKLRIFTDKSPDAIGTPSLYVSVTQNQGTNQFENHFFSLQCFFGQIRSTEDGLGVSMIHEDHKGWKGSADLVVTCTVPTFGLLTGPRNGIRAALMITTTPDTIMKSRHLGQRMTVFEAGLSDEKRLLICCNAPSLDSVNVVQMENRWVRASMSHNSSTARSLVKMDSSSRATHVQNHLDFPQDLPEGKALSNGSQFRTSEKSSHTLVLEISNTPKRKLIFPCPIPGSSAKIRIARKSS